MGSSTKHDDETSQIDRREFVRRVAVAPLVAAPIIGNPSLLASPDDDLPKLHVVSAYKPAKVPGMPGPYPGKVIKVSSEKVVDTTTNVANADVVREMMARGITALTGDKTPLEAWKRFVEPSDIVGIKVNCGGYPHCVSAYEIVAETIAQLKAAGVPPTQVFIYERFKNQLDETNYKPHVPEGVTMVAAESANRYTDNSGYDPAVFVEADLFGEEDTRSAMMKLVSQKLTKIINIPNMKDHGATGVTGCLKNIAYGSFSNVARTHAGGKSHTYSFVPTLASTEPVRSRTVLQIMDGIRGVWHGGPFARTRKYLFFPKQIMFGTDPVAIDALLLDIIDDKRKAEGAISIWNRDPKSLRVMDGRARDADPNVNILIREPGHVAYAAKLGLGIADKAKIKVQEIVV